MTRNEAIENLGEGHTIWSPRFAERICEALGIPFREHLVEAWNSEGGKGATMKPEHEGGTGVSGGVLAQYAAEELGVRAQATNLRGRGSQAREYARVVQAELESREKAKIEQIKEKLQQ